MTAKKPNLRAAQKQMTLLLIRQTAREIIYTEPYDSVTMEQIARAAGVSRATVYLHYSSKSEILLDILSENMEEQMAVYAALAQIGQVNLATIRAWLQSYRALMDRHHAVRHLFSILFMQLPDRKHFVSNHREKAIAVLGERFPGFCLTGMRGKQREKKRVRCYLMLFELEHAAINFSLVPDMPDIEIGLDVLAEQLLHFCQENS